VKVYDLRFGRHALRRWKRLDLSIRKQFVRKLEKVVLNPHNPSDQLRGFKDSYRLKLRKVGYRLGYRVHDTHVVIVVIAVGRRDKDKVYEDFALYYHEGEL
jgi:mRNA interferase RelE/StbE